MGTLAVPHFSVQEYLAAEQVAEFPSEYIDGEVFPIEAATPVHSYLAFEVGKAISSRLADLKCRVGTQMRVKVSPVKYLSPDLAIVCGQSVTLDALASATPKVIIEVLSPGTEGYDRGRKFSYYRGIPTLEEYVLVSQDALHVEVFTRTPENFWLLRAYDGREAEAELMSLGPVRLPLAEIYAGLEFPPEEA